MTGLPFGRGVFLLTRREGRTLLVSLGAAAIALVLDFSAIVLVLGPASQLVIPFLRGWASGSWELALILAAVIAICAVSLVVILRRAPQGAGVS